MARAGGATTASAGSENAAATLPAYRLLTADGLLSTETSGVRPIMIRAGETASATFDHPPGLYGTEDGFSAVNLLPPGAELSAFDPAPIGRAVTREGLAGGEAVSLRPALFAAAFAMLILDSLIVLFINGAFSRLPKGARRRSGAAAAGIAAIALGLLAFQPHPVSAQEMPEGSGAKAGDEQILEHLDTTHLAYVTTGEADVDRISEQGLAGLTEFLTYRTTLEPGAPVGLDITRDELSFYPIIYWPISANAPMPSQAAISRIDAYMRNGGTVLFDTRDQYSSLGGGGSTPNGERLQQILANIDIPPLEPVPENHVLARSFYLLTNFPGRYNGSALWVEARQDARNSANQVSSGGDGVSPIMITGNDLAGAWAVDQQGAPVLPTVPPDDMQREYAYRAGVNIMMYMLTGNYKADQVHVPALLERLGQ
ncbi:hypothetical protein D3C80_1096520 [compost metagenome]